VTALLDSSVPDGWDVRTLGEVATTQLGKVIDPKEKNRPPRLPYLRNANVQWDRFELSDVFKMHFSEHESAKYRVEPGDLLVCEGGIVGRAAIWTGEIPDVHFQNALHRIRSRNPLVSAEWLLENLRNLASNGYLADRAQGNTIQHLSQQELRALPIVVPPRSVQDGLIATISALRISQASAGSHVAQARHAIERFRRAVLVAACSGRLTTEWRMNQVDLAVPTSQEINELQAGSRRLRRGVDASLPTDDLNGLELPATWERRTVAWLLSSGALTDVKDGNHGANHPRVSEFTPQGLPFITANCVHGGKIDYDAAPKLAGEPLNRLRVGFSEADDVVLTHKGTVGRVAVASQASVLTPQTTYYRCAAGAIDPHYLAIFMESLYFYVQLAHVMSQTTRDFVPISKQYALTIVLPSLAEQVEIVRCVSQLLAAADRLLQRVASARRRVDRSSQAFLAKTFRSELAGSRAEGS
jgi:type I restriction enzyme S subunit